MKRKLRKCRQLLRGTEGSMRDGADQGPDAGFEAQDLQLLFPAVL